MIYNYFDHNLPLNYTNICIAIIIGQHGVVWICFIGSKNCNIVSVDVSNCAADADSCKVTKGQAVNMTMKFTTSLCYNINYLYDNYDHEYNLQMKTLLI